MKTRGAVKGTARLDTKAIGRIHSRSMAFSIVPDLELIVRKTSFQAGESVSKWICDAIRQRLARGI